jgi:LmbE family N-acetylglucosaminyl deacetylase
MRIAAIHAHPDDSEILAGGTLALLAAQQHEITLVTLSDGDCGSNEHPPFEIARIRKAEAARAAALIGASYLWGGFHDLAIFNDAPSRRRVTALIRHLRPELVLTSAPSDYLADHEMTALLVRDACFGAAAPNYQTTGFGDPPALTWIPHLYFMDPIEGLDREGRPVTPDFTVDVTSTFATKRAMLACHESQRNWLRDQHGMDDYLDTMEQWTRRRAAECGPPDAQFAEGFRQYRGHPYPRTPLLQSLLNA